MRVFQSNVCQPETKCSTLMCDPPIWGEKYIVRILLFKIWFICWHTGLEVRKTNWPKSDIIPKSCLKLTYYGILSHSISLSPTNNSYLGNHEVMTNVIVNTSESKIHKNVTWTDNHISWTKFHTRYSTKFNLIKYFWRLRRYSRVIHLLIGLN